MLRCCAFPLWSRAAGTAPGENARWQQYAKQVHIIRDNWGIAHVYGKSDADAVFGMIYAQAEDDFNRIERNYLISLGWLAQAEGESALYSDLRARLFIDVGRLQQQYRGSPAWLKSLMDAWADGLNYFLSKHPDVHAKVIQHFEPWMALSFTEGSIGGDIETIDLKQLEKFYGPSTPPTARSSAVSGPDPEESPGGSNGFAIAPKLTASGHAMLWINPHTSYYFRCELQMVSEQGLNVYGAVTWGQFFVYQGFNPHNGWMHTSYGGDAIDEYAEDLVKKSDGLYYRYGSGAQETSCEPQSVIPVKGSDEPLLHGVSQSSRTDHSRGKWQVDRHQIAAGAGAGVIAILLAHENHRLRVLPQDPGHAHRYVQQHGVCGRQWHDRLLPWKFHSEARYLV